MILDFSTFDKSVGDQYQNLPDEVKLFLKEWFSDVSVISVKTSGSTGMPKVFEIEKKRMLNSAKMTCDFLGLKAGDMALLALPMEYISGKMMLVRAIERQMKIIVREPMLSPLENLKERVDFCAMTPLQVEHSLDYIHWVKNLIIGGASVSESLKKKIHGMLKPQVSNFKPNTIYETYGMSETLSHIAIKSIFPKEEDYFKVLGGVEISQDERGCLVINAPLLNSDKLVTNDLVELKNGKEFRFFGRIDYVINSGGVKIFPESLEAWVKKFIPNELVFIGLPDEVLGQRLALVVEGEENIDFLSQFSNLEFEKPYFRPKEIIFVKKIPRTANDKVNRLGLLANLKSI